MPFSFWIDRRNYKIVLHQLQFRVTKCDMNIQVIRNHITNLPKSLEHIPSTPLFYSCQTTVSKHWSAGDNCKTPSQIVTTNKPNHWRENIAFHILTHPKLTWGFSNFVFEHWRLLVTWGMVAMPLVSPLTKYFYCNYLSVFIQPYLGSYNHIPPVRPFRSRSSERGNLRNFVVVAIFCMQKSQEVKVRPTEISNRHHVASLHSTWCHCISCSPCMLTLVLASEGWWETWQTSPKVTRSGQRQSWKTPRWVWGKQVHGVGYFPFRALTLLVG